MKREIKLYYGRFIKLIKDIFDRAITDNFTGVGAQMSYYFILALFPFLIFLIAFLSYTKISSQDIILNLSNYLPPDVFNIINVAITNTIHSTNTTWLSVGALSTVWVASNGIESLIVGINNAYDITETRPYWKTKFLAIIMTFALATVYVFSLVMVVFGGLIINKIFLFVKISGIILYLVNVTRFVIPVGTIFIVFLILYNYLPARKIGFKKILPGAVLSTIGWMLISQLFSIYIEKFGTFAQAYGSLGGIIVLLLWLYWCGITIMLGAELNAALYYFRVPKRRRIIPMQQIQNR